MLKRGQRRSAALRAKTLRESCRGRRWGSARGGMDMWMIGVRIMRISRVLWASPAEAQPAEIQAP